MRADCARLAIRYAHVLVIRLAQRSQYLFKTNRPAIPFDDYADPVVQAAVDQRKQFFSKKLDQLFTVENVFAIVIEGTLSETGITASLARIPQDPHGGLQELKAQFSNDKRKVLLREQIEVDLLRLEQRTHSFVRQLSDLVQIDISLGRPIRPHLQLPRQGELDGDTEIKKLIALTR